jgi:hypothetical protein
MSRNLPKKMPKNSTAKSKAEAGAGPNTGPMTAEQSEQLKKLARDAYDLDAFRPRLTQAQAQLRIAGLHAKLKLQDGPPHTL